jgi:hypothetical protein
VQEDLWAQKIPAGKKSKPLTKKERKEQRKKRKEKHISYE